MLSYKEVSGRVQNCVPRKVRNLEATFFRNDDWTVIESLGHSGGPRVVLV